MHNDPVNPNTHPGKMFAGAYGIIIIVPGSTRILCLRTPLSVGRTQLLDHPCASTFTEIETLTGHSVLTSSDGKNWLFLFPKKEVM